MTNKRTGRLRTLVPQGHAPSRAPTAWRTRLERAGATTLTAASILLALIWTVLLRSTNLNRSFDIFVDEVNYLSVARGVLETGRPATFEGPFYLHPPAFFFMQAGFLELMQPAGNLVDQLYSARFLNVFLAGLSAVLVFLIARRAAGLVAAAAATLLFALEPWVIRINSRNFLETAAMLWILVGYAVLVYSARARRHWPVVAGAGLAFGLALLTKELTLFTTLLPLGVCFVFGWAFRRTTLLLTALAALGVYAVYPLWVLLDGRWSEFAWQKSSGILRLAGLQVSTGFGRGAGQSFAGAVLGNLGQFATTYAIVAAGIVATALLWRRAVELRLLAVWAVCAYAAQAFNVVAGTNEEHLFYYLVVPAMLACSAAAAQLFGSLKARASRQAIGAIAAVALVYIGWGGALWTMRHTTPDNGTERLLGYVEQHVAAGSRIATTTMTSNWVLTEEQWQTGRWATPDAICQNKADYVVISSRLVQTGQDIATPELSAWLALKAEPVFVFEGPSTGTLSLYQLPPQACAAEQSYRREKTTLWTAQPNRSAMLKRNT